MSSRLALLTLLAWQCAAQVRALEEAGDGGMLAQLGSDDTQLRGLRGMW
jgi:hypothetical protein